MIWQLTKRDIASRYKGSILGNVWLFIQPIFMLAIYTYVFGIVFKSRWGGEASGNKTEFALILFSGLIVYNLFAECTGRAPSVIIGHVNYVKKVVFPVEILSWVTFLSSLYTFFSSLLILISFKIFLDGFVPITFLLVPFSLIPVALLCLGLIWFLSSLGVFLRDLQQMVNILIQVLIFVCPIFYPLEVVPAGMQKIILLNPLTTLISINRDLLIWGRVPSLLTYFTILGACALFCLMGFIWFQKTRPTFSDVL